MTQEGEEYPTAQPAVPLYESNGDRSNEKEIVAILMRCWRCHEALKLPMVYGLDYMLMRDGKAAAFAEIKVRNLHFGATGGYYLSLLKATRAFQLSATTGLPCFLAVRFSDGIVRWANFAKAAGVIEHGRDDRPDDPQAYEPCVVFDWQHFQSLHDNGPA